MAGSLDDLVAASAAQLMAATARNAAVISQRVLRDLVEHFGVDFGFLRHNDHTIRATVLVAEWPPRENVPDPDPIAVVYFADADSVFARAEHMKTPDVLRPEEANADYQRNIQHATGVPISSLACVPLLSGDVTTGSLGFVHFGDLQWRPEELNALQTIAMLFAQLQARIAAEEQVLYLAEHDDLTGLLNRRTLIVHLDERLAEGRPGPVSVLLLDVNRLKVINDHLGHNAGDRFIKAFADLLREATDVPSVIGRFGGDEFVVVPAAPMGIDDAETFAKWLAKRVHRQVFIDGEMLSRSVSIGVAVGDPGHDNTAELLRRADQAALSAKSSRSREVTRFSPEMSEKYAIRNDIELQLEGTIDSGKGGLVLHYLPEFDMRTGQIMGAEALIRWQHPTRGLLMPESFVGVAESINLAGRLGRLVMRTAFEHFTQWRSRGVALDAVLRVNVSPIQLVAEGIVDAVGAALDTFGLDPAAVCLEITETVVVQDIEATRRTLSGLKDIGVHIALDDFGTGYSGLAYLKSLPVDTLKIDKSFIRDLGRNTGDLAIVRSVVALADALGLDVVAEGVETATAARTLIEMNCFRAQGFLLSRPLGGPAMESLFAQRLLPMDFSAREDALLDDASTPDSTMRRERDA